MLCNSINLLQDTDDAMTIMGETLCLMSCVMQSGNQYYPERITDNPMRLAAFSGADAGLRRVCRKLFDHWEARLNGYYGHPLLNSALAEAALQRH